MAFVELIIGATLLAVTALEVLEVLGTILFRHDD